MGNHLDDRLSIDDVTLLPDGRGPKVVEGTIAYMAISEDARLYYKQRGGGNGFDAILLLWCAGKKACDWNHCDVEVIFRAEASYDGVRHLWWGDGEDAGYIYYPDLEDIAVALGILKRLCERCCSDCRKQGGAHG